MKNIVVTHTDLDGVVSGYLAGIAFDTNTIVSSNYSEVMEKFEMVKEQFGRDVHLIVTDLNILPAELQYAIRYFKKVTMFDHHPSSEKYMPLNDINENFNIYFNDQICATTLVEKYMLDAGHEFTDIEKDFYRYVNIYDTWKAEHKEFIQARIANDLFWYYGWTNFLKKLQIDGVFDIPNGLSKDELKHCKNLFETIDHAIDTAEWYNTDCGSAIVILEEDQKNAINLISLKKNCSQTGIYYNVYYVKNRYKCSVRVDLANQKNYQLGEEIVKYINISDFIKNGGGHGPAIGIEFQESASLQEVLTDIEKFDTFIFDNRSKDVRSA